MAGNDLFTWIDALYNKKRLDGTPPIFMIHRFLASDQDLAPFARCFQLELKRTPAVAFRTWQGLLPKSRSAPRFSYIAPKKGPAAEELTQRMMKVLAERRVVVEEMLEILELANKTRETYIYFGIENAEEAQVPARKARGGLLAGLQ